MSRRKKVQEQPLPAAALPEKEMPRCSNCPFYWEKNSTHGECRRRISPHINSNFLTEFGPLGNFIIMQGNSICGEHPDYSCHPRFNKDSLEIQ